MPWPKGKPHSPEQVSKRIETLKANGRRHKKAIVIDGVEFWECGRCHRVLPSNEYYSCKRSHNGLKSYCKSCHSINSLQSRDMDRARKQKVLYEAKRRAWKAKSNGSVSSADINTLHSILGVLCLKCGSSKDVQIDHIVPLSRGGPHLPTNLQPLCRICNERKQARTADYRTEEQKAMIEIEFRRI